MGEVGGGLIVREGDCDYPIIAHHRPSRPGVYRDNEVVLPCPSVY